MLMKREERELDERFAYFIETIKLMSFGVLVVLLMFHPIILLCIIFNFVERGNLLQNIFLMLIWFCDLAASALLAILVGYVRERQSHAA